MNLFHYNMGNYECSLNLNNILTCRISDKTILIKMSEGIDVLLTGRDAERFIRIINNDKTKHIESEKQKRRQEKRERDYVEKTNEMERNGYRLDKDGNWYKPSTRWNNNGGNYN